jgi:hypothetical protein
VTLFRQSAHVRLQCLYRVEHLLGATQGVQELQPPPFVGKLRPGTKTCTLPEVFYLLD